MLYKALTVINSLQIKLKLSAVTSRLHRFQARAWWLQLTLSHCGHWYDKWK